MNFVKKTVLTILACTCFFTVSAQKATTTTRSVAQTPDTTEAVPKHVKIRMVGGGKMSSANDVVQNISKSKDHTTFTSSINASGLAETLKSRGPITVFAPTNEAFNKLKPGKLDTLLKPVHNSDLTQLLTYHVINGRFTSKQIAKKISEGKGEATFTTLTGSKLRAKINADRNIVLIDENDNQAIISEFDIEQNNGIIDVINTVLVPKPK